MKQRKITLEMADGKKMFAVDVPQDGSTCYGCVLRKIECVRECDPHYRGDGRNVYFASTNDLRMWAEYHQQRGTAMQ